MVLFRVVFFFSFGDIFFFIKLRFACYMYYFVVSDLLDFFTEGGRISNYADLQKSIDITKGIVNFTITYVQDNCGLC